MNRCLFIPSIACFDYKHGDIVNKETMDDNTKNQEDVETDVETFSDNEDLDDFRDPELTYEDRKKRKEARRKQREAAKEAQKKAKRQRTKELKLLNLRY